MDINNLHKFNLFLRFLSFTLFLLVIAALFLGSVKILSFEFTSRLSMFIIWILWWPFLYITLLFAGRLWCGFLCPIRSGIDAGNNLGGWLKIKKINLVRYSLIPYLLFLFLVFWEEVSGLFTSSMISAVFFSVFFLSAFIFGIFTPRYSFCRVVCPIGTILSPFSRISILGIRTDRSKCGVCRERYCLVGRKKEPCPVFNNIPLTDSNSNCLLCTYCIKNCPHDSAKLRWMMPGKEIIEKKGFDIGGSLFIISLIGLFFIMTSEGTAMVRKLFPLDITGIYLRLFDFIFAISFILGLFVLISYIASKMTSKGLNTILKEYGYIFTPLLYFASVSIVFVGFLNPYIGLSKSTVYITRYALVGLGALSSFYIMKRWKFRFREYLPWGAFLVMIVLIFLAAPSKEAAAVSAGKGAVEITSYTMGFNPSIIKAKVGARVVLNINNQDIVHAFDIDEMDIHYILPAGKRKRIEFIADKIGEFEFYCSIPGHKEGGMKGILVVER